MTDQEWGQLRRELAKRFDEDIVQQVLLELLEVQATGVAVLDPLRWCKRVASRDAKDRGRQLARRRTRAPIGKNATRAPENPLDRLVAREALRGHEGKALEAELSEDPKRAADRRYKRRQRAAGAA